jgi:hypothetical protein
VAAVLAAAYTICRIGGGCKFPSELQSRPWDPAVVPGTTKEIHGVPDIPMKISKQPDGCGAVYEDCINRARIVACYSRARAAIYSAGCVAVFLLCKGGKA